MNSLLINRKTILAVAVLSLVLAACSKKEEHEPSAIEQAGQELGHAAAQDLKEEINQAKDVGEQAQQAAENLDKQIDEQTTTEEEKP
ncbi:hypothetical protein HPT27_12305 [Permianibacter sp. IMCC34836]|uniref:hypothetical protein n=1 Tax=Permianibacter fluminis TaxID=2738515 RepID=UPI001554C8CA|nr:hypothetical protein [Permianibacter fluminis]NQD37810.1 hypothetical protein [Permianibacter fluminis]